jgi:hypothetical protein
MTDLVPTTPLNPLDLDPRFIADLALGLEPAVDTASRYGFTAEQWDSLRTNKHLQSAVARKLTELKKEGVTFKVKASIMAEDLLAKLYAKAVDAETGATTLLSILQYLTKVSDLEPKVEKGAGISGPGFQINIVLPPADQPAQAAIEGHAVRES